MGMDKQLEAFALHQGSIKDYWSDEYPGAK
jgi:hypothetical protein